MIRRVFIVGAAKSGTTSLARNLARHPAISFDPNNKEPGFHIRDYLVGLDESCPMMAISKFIKDEAVYKSLFKKSQGIDAQKSTYLLDASTAYLPHYRYAIPSIKNSGVNISEDYILIMLREPRSRMFSQYRQMVKNGVEPLSFEEALRAEDVRKRQGRHPFYQYTDYSLYADGVLEYLKRFNKVKVISYEIYKENQREVIADVMSFLDLEFADTSVDENTYNATSIKYRNSFSAYFFSTNRFPYAKRLFRAFTTYGFRQWLFRKFYALATAPSEERYSIPVEVELRLQQDESRLQSLLKPTMGD